MLKSNFLTLMVCFSIFFFKLQNATLKAMRNNLTIKFIISFLVSLYYQEFFIRLHYKVRRFVNYINSKQTVRQL